MAGTAKWSDGGRWGEEGGYNIAGLLGGPEICRYSRTGRPRDCRSVPVLGVTVGAFGANLCKSADKMYRGILRCLLDWLSNKRLVIEKVAFMCSFVCPIFGIRQTDQLGFFAFWFVCLVGGGGERLDAMRPPFRLSPGAPVRPTLPPRSVGLPTGGLLKGGRMAIAISKMSLTFYFFLDSGQHENAR